MARLPSVAVFKPEARPLTVTLAQARGAAAIGALAVGSAAIGGFAIGRLSVGRLAIGRAAIGRLTIKRLEGQDLQDIYGTYAPHGDCQREPRILVDGSGFTYRVAGKDTRSSTIEWALSYMGQDYRGISRWFFPFPVSDDDFGRVLMTINPDERPGTLKFEPNLGPGQSLSPLQAALVRGSPYAKCGMQATPAPPPKSGAAPAVPVAPPPEASAAPAWQTRNAAGHLLAMAVPIDSVIKTLSVFCDQGKPVLAMLLKMHPPAGPVTLTFVFRGWTVNVPMAPGNRDGTLWLADLSRSELPQWLAHRGRDATRDKLARLSTESFLRINGTTQGEVSLKDSTAATRAALSGCYRY